MYLFPVLILTHIEKMFLDLLMFSVSDCFNQRIKGNMKKYLKLFSNCERFIDIFM